MITEIKQGDHYWIDLDSKDVPELDSNWGGEWQIAETVGGTALASGLLTISADKAKLQLRVTPTDTAGLDLAYYWLTAQVKNTTIGFNKEYQEQIQIIAQGIA